MILDKDLRIRYSFNNHITFKMEGIYIGSNLTGYTINGDDIGFESYNSSHGTNYIFFI